MVNVMHLCAIYIYINDMRLICYDMKKFMQIIVNDLVRLLWNAMCGAFGFSVRR